MINTGAGRYCCAGWIAVSAVGKCSNLVGSGHRALIVRRNQLNTIDSLQRFLAKED
jgi:hypothetical protein